MRNHSWPVSILLSVWLLCQCGNGIGDDGRGDVSGSNRTQEPSHPIAKITPTSLTAPASPLTLPTNITLTSSTPPPPSSTQTQSPLTTPTPPYIDSSTVVWSKLSPENNGSDGNGGRNPELEGAQLENDNGNRLQSTQSSSSSSVSSTTANLLASSSTTITTSPSPTFTPSTYATIKSQEQQLQQRSKLWAPHSNVNVADLLNGLDDDGEVINSGESSSSTNAILSSSTFTSTPPPVSPSTSHKSNMNHLLSEKLTGQQQQQQTRSIRSIRLIANNNSSGGGAHVMTKLPHSSQDSVEGSQQAGPGNVGESDEGNENEEEGAGSSPIFHVNNNKFPVISSIRHYRSRKSFSRTRKTPNPNSGSDAASMSDNISNIQDKNSVPTATTEEVATKSKTFKGKWSISRVKPSSSEEIPQGDEPPQAPDENDEEHYYGRVETRKKLRTKSHDNFPDEDDDHDGGGAEGHYGKVMDKPMGTASLREKSGYSSSPDDTYSPGVYEHSYFTGKEHETSSFEDIASVKNGRRRQNNSSRNRDSDTPRKDIPESGEGKDDTLILQRINKTFLSRNSNARRQQQRQMEMTSENIARHGGAPSIRPRASDPSNGISSDSSSLSPSSGSSINTSSYRNPPPDMMGSSASFFGSNKENRVRLKATLNDSDYGNAESGKSHSLPDMYSTSLNESHFGSQPTGEGGRKKQRNRDRSGGQSRQQNKERRGRQKGTRKPSAILPNDPFSSDESGSESRAKDFYALQGQQSKPTSSSFSRETLRSGTARARQSNSDHVDSMDGEIEDDDGYSKEQRRKQRPQRVHQIASQQHSQSSLSNSDKSNRRKESDPLTGKRGSMSEIRELKGKPDHDDLVKSRKSSEFTEYFPRVESYSGSDDHHDHPISGAGISNDNLFDEYRPLGHEYYSGGSDLLLDDDVGIESASPLSGTPSSGTSSATPRNKPDSDIVTRFLNIVESQHLVGENCTAGTDFNLGEGVVDRYAQERFRLEAEFSVNRANMLTRMWKYVNTSVLHNEYLLHAMVISLVEFDADIFAGGNCYDQFQYKNYSLFCPFAFRYDGDTILVKDLSLEYNYLGNTSEFFFIARKNAERIIKSYNQFNRGFHQFRINETSMTDPIPDEVLNVTYEDGKWSKPYFDCGGANIWMITYTVPFFGYDNATKTYHFKGTSGIDINLRSVDIDQCPLPDNSTELNIFAGSDKCKNATTMCVAISGLGFRRGSYRCVCKDGFYFPNVTSPHKYYNGTVLEEEYEKKFDSNDTNYYDMEGVFECLRCPAGCDTCVDDRPCVVSLNWLMRSAILILQCAIILMLPIVGLFTFKYSDVKVVRAASPVLLRFIVLGAFFIYCTILVMYPSPSVITCTLRVWLREIGFSLAYGALMLKTWRISVIFRVRSAKAIKITDLDLMKRLGIIVAMFTALLVIRTLVAPPAAIVSLTADDLKAWLCKTDWWDHSFTLMELSFLVWGIRLCIVVRKAPSEFNESKFISLAIYNEFLLSLFLNISMLFLQSPANPDLLYIIFFCHVQLTMTLLLCLIFGSKAYMVFRGQGKGSTDESSRIATSKFISKGRSGGQGNKQLSAHNSTGGLHSSNTSTGHDPNFNSRLSEDVQEEFRRLYSQLEELKERNMRLGNRHLVAKIAAMQEAADNIFQAPASQINGQSHQLSPGNNSGANNGGNGFPSASSSGGGGGGHSPNTKGKSPSAFGPLSDIQEENPLQSLSSGHGQLHSAVGPKVLETSIDIVIQSPSRKTAQELGDNEQENNLNNGAHHQSLPHPLARGVEEGDFSANPISGGITHNRNTDSSAGQLNSNSSTGPTACERKGESSTTLNKKDKCVSIEEAPQTLTKQEKQTRSKKSNSPSTSPSKQQGSKSSKSEKLLHKQGSPSTCQKSGEAAASSSDGKAVNHKDAAASSDGNGGSQKIILDLDDKSRFTEEITV